MVRSGSGARAPPDRRGSRAVARADSGQETGATGATRLRPRSAAGAAPAHRAPGRIGPRQLRFGPLRSGPGVCAAATGRHASRPYRNKKTISEPSAHLTHRSQGVRDRATPLGHSALMTDRTCAKTSRRPHHWQTYPLARGNVDEFLLRAPASLRARKPNRAVSATGGGSTWIERADTRDLVDAPARALGPATGTALDDSELPLALRPLLGHCTIRSLPAAPVTGRAQERETPPAKGVLEETVMRLRDPSRGSVTIERPHLPFTPAEFARARALVELHARLDPIAPRADEHVLALPEGNEITVRRADQGDLEAARAMHDRCSDRTLRLRYHGPVRDADRYLDHLLSPRFGRSLAAQTASGRLVALGHLLWDGDETEVALLVEDEWQRRGIGSELLRRLVALAVEAGCENVYAVTRASHTGMVAAMRALALPLGYQIEEGTVVITARLDATPVRSLPPHEQAGHRRAGRSRPTDS
ncbi:GNAT family N-acetyltransferase [Streptomyces sp. NPDC001834]|uniref:GNAT family N-acetyltransferase n=1 Tax=Streptomyces sp. NPDC001834 TaxID=3364616 RepID=UPI00367EC98B